MTVFGPKVSIRQLLWMTWAEVAIDALRRAKLARDKTQRARRGRQAVGAQAAGGIDGLGEEFRACLVGIVASAAAIEAFRDHVDQKVEEVERIDLPWHAEGAKRPRAWKQALDILNLGVDLGGRPKLQQDLQQLFNLRGSALHHREETAEPVPHPVGHTNVSKEHGRYTVEALTTAVDLMLWILGRAVKAPRPPLASWPSEYGHAIAALQAQGITEGIKLSESEVI